MNFTEACKAMDRGELVRCPTWATGIFIRKRKDSWQYEFNDGSIFNPYAHPLDVGLNSCWEIYREPVAPPKPKATCVNCRFIHRSECRRNPPIRVAGEIEAQWPTIYCDDWCGQHEFAGIIPVTSTK